MFSPLIVPPTFYKDLNNVLLSTIWNRTDVALQKVKHTIFCGYSFPDADIHIKYLLKRAQTNRNSPLTFTVINHHPGKDPELARQEKYRYERFLGTGVDFTGGSFEEFTDNPFTVIQRAGSSFCGGWLLTTLAVCFRVSRLLRIRGLESLKGVPEILPITRRVLHYLSVLFQMKTLANLPSGVGVQARLQSALWFFVNCP